MERINNREDILANIATLDKYLENKLESEYDYALDKIKKGNCFIAVQSGKDSYKFYPSRFIGYKNNTMNSHEDNPDKDGRKTNIYIREALGKKEAFDALLENKYLDYCSRLGITPAKREKLTRKYWVL